MKRLVISLALAAAAHSAFAADVGVSISVGQPGFYGQINIGDFPPPVLINRAPVIIDRGPGYAGAAPIYLRVPPGHRRHWNRNCYRYNACGRPVLFVEDNWYNQVYVPQYTERYRQERFEPRGPRGHERWEDGRGRGPEGRGHEGRGHEDHGYENRGHEGHGRGHGRD